MGAMKNAFKFLAGLGTVTFAYFLLPSLSSAQASDDVLCVAKDADLYLSQGAYSEAWAVAQGCIQADTATADIYVTAAKAALSRVKLVPLLSKKKWAKRGRLSYRAALAADSMHPEALLGLATLALRAPDDFGGGQEAYMDYQARLLAASPAHALLLEARQAFAQGKPSAVDTYEIALLQLPDDVFLAEYLKAARQFGANNQAYSFLQAGFDVSGCASFYEANLALQSGQSTVTVLDAYSAFIASGETHCNRQPVLGAALEAAITLAREAEDARLDLLEETLAALQQEKDRQEHSR
ncbi:MAG: hypothetical protein AAGJ09_02240 [Pseudomonadota bacterium]